jgi:hypothetical protein
MDEFSGQAAVDELASRWAIHDGVIHQVTIRRDAACGVVIELDCTARHESPVAKTRLRLEHVASFDVSWAAETEFLLIPGYKALMLPSSEIYLSLDPYDDRVSEPDGRDRSVFVARYFRVSFKLKAKT